MAFFTHRLRLTKNPTSKQLRASVGLACLAAFGNVDAEPTTIQPNECSIATSTHASDQTIVIGRLLGNPTTTDRAILIKGSVIWRIGTVAEMRSLSPHADTIECNDSYISPGFVNAHEHPPYSAGKPGPNVLPVYENRYQWQGRAGDQYKEIAYSRVENDAQLYWVELRHLLAGTTTIAGNGAVPGLVKNVGTGDRTDGFVYQADMNTFPFPQAIDAFKKLPWPYQGPSFEPELTDGADVTSAYVPHIAEGTDKISRLEAEFFLDFVEENPGRRYAMIHGVGLSSSSVPRMQSLDVTLVWSPRSNLSLYGATVDLSHLFENDVRIALSTDWSYSGSYNMLESFRCARYVAENQRHGSLSAQNLWQMATENGAYALNLEQSVGSLEPGFAADLVILRARSDKLYDDLVSSGVSDVVATFVDGKLVTGNSKAFDLSELPPSCANRVGDHFVCDDLTARNFTWEQLLTENESAVPLFNTTGQAKCEY